MMADDEEVGYIVSVDEGKVSRAFGRRMVSARTNDWTYHEQSVRGI